MQRYCLRRLIGLLLVVGACAACAPAAQPAPTSPQPASTPRSVPVPTPAAPEPPIDALLRANPIPCMQLRADACETLWGVQLLEHLHRYPASPRRAAIIERAAKRLGHGPSNAFAWLIDAWFEQALLQPLAAARGRLPAGFAEQWQQHGQIVETDLDADRQPDFLVTFQAGYQAGVEFAGELRWVRQVAGRYQAASLPTSVDGYATPLRPTIRAVRDMNGDGHTDVVYTISTCGAATCFEHLRSFAWQEGAWRDLMPTRWNTTNGEWIFEDQPDGSTTLIGERNHPGYDLGPLLESRVSFAPVNGVFAPIDVSARLALGEWQELSRARPASRQQQIEQAQANSTQLAVDVRLLQRSQQLTYMRQITESLAYLQPVAERIAVPSAQDGYGYRAHTRLRLGMARLLLGDLAAMRTHWRQIEQQSPGTPIAATATTLLALVQRPQDVWRACATLRRHAPMWRSIELGGAYAAAFEWRDQCDERVLLARQVWPQQIPIAEQLRRQGLGWELISAAYDLNGDGIADPIGVLDNHGSASPWVWLSHATEFRPLFAADTVPLDAMALAEADQFLPMQALRDMRVTDLDANGAPEILLAGPAGFWLMEWADDRFRRHAVPFGPDAPPGVHVNPIWSGVVEGVAQANGSRALRVALADEHGQPVGEWRFTLVRGALQRSPAPAMQPSGLHRAIEALFHANDPDQALRILAAFVPAAAGDDPAALTWQRAEAEYLRGLAHAHRGEAALAQQLWRTLGKQRPRSPWGVLARTHLAGT